MNGRARVAGVLALSIAAGGALAQRNAIDIKVRPAGTTQWLDVYQYGSPANLDHVEVAVFYEFASGYGFAGSVHNVIVDNWSSAFSVGLLDRPDSAQHPDGRQGRFNFGAQRQATYTTGADAGTLRIAAANNTQNVAAGGIAVRQQNPVEAGALFDTGNPVLGFRFDLFFDTPDFAGMWPLFTPLNRVQNFAVYQTAQDSILTNIPLSQVVLDGALITPFPSPSALALLGISAALSRCRRSPNG